MMTLLLIKENHFRRLSSRVIFILSYFLSTREKIRGSPSSRGLDIISTKILLKRSLSSEKKKKKKHARSSSTTKKTRRHVCFVVVDDD